MLQVSQIKLILLPSQFSSFSSQSWEKDYFPCQVNSRYYIERSLKIHMKLLC